MSRYELLERIGAGGMAEIFRGRAVAAGGFEKLVAIKRILPHLGRDSRFVEMLIAEAKTLSQLRHRNIVQIFDVGLGSDGQYFLVMEYIDGVDLGALIDALDERRKRLPVDLALHVATEVCEALEHAHRVTGPDGKPLGLVHRDVSPGNVLLSRAGEVKLSDFGIAKQAEEVTGHGSVRGKFAYIAPEQARNEHVDARSDVFSVGVVLWELLLDRLYSRMQDFEALAAVREAKLPRPRDIDPSIDPTLEALLRRALARRPDDRFASAGELGAALRELRYAAPETVADPAKELAGIVARIVPPGTKGAAPGHTVVRIQTAAGFSPAAVAEAAAKEEGAVDDEADPFEDESTRIARLPRDAIPLPAPALTPPPQPLVIAPSHPAPAPAPRPPPLPPAVARPSPPPVPSTRATGPARAVTPTIRELFYSGALLSGRSEAISQEEQLATEDLMGVPRRRLILMVTIFAMALAVIAFAIAAHLLTDGGSPAPQPPPANERTTS